MGGLHWIGENLGTTIDHVGVIGSLLIATIAFRSETKTRRVANLLTITTNHREIWTEFSRRPDLARVLDPSANLFKAPVTRAEGEFVNMVILHVSSAHYAMKDQLVINLEGLRRDVCEIFSLPIPRAIWDKNKVFQNGEFVKFVEQCLNWK